jgi:hypothetical protein
MANHERVGRLQNAANKVAMEAYLQGISQGKERNKETKFCEIFRFSTLSKSFNNFLILFYYNHTGIFQQARRQATFWYPEPSGKSNPVSGWIADITKTSN